ncbi:MAG: hypothetical protein F6K42_18125 [Leptolyngbya sp. SIO1D8]|nr:hypothetical protein [Leptolyngbya sp. SIO1D8]
MRLMSLLGNLPRSPRLVYLTLIAGSSLLAIVPQETAKAQSQTLAAECNQFATVVGQNQQIMASFNAEIEAFSQNASQAETLEDIQAAARQYVEAVNGVIENLDTLVDDLNVLSLSDEPLSSYRNQYSAVVEGFNESLMIAAEAMNGVAEAESEEVLPERVETLQTDTVGAVEQIQQLAAEETDIIQNVNTHCGVES